MKRDVSSPQAYLDAVPEAQMSLVTELRGLIREAVPGAVEEIRWGMLCYDDSGALFALAAQKNSVNLYVMATQALEDMAGELAALDHGKSCLRFKKLSGVPTETIRRLLAHARTLREREYKAQP
ncbi:MAG: DUF1801 domain-containing protein [Isosphaeraceae bacterium]|nr:DUF1801 domain-containing protein [Isosphaeraceae bacterium]